MLGLVELVIAALSLVALLMSASLAVEVAVAMMSRDARNCQKAATRSGRVAVLVPAHDEEQGIAATLANVRPQLAGGDRLLVVADNCADRTAAVARSGGAEVIERHDPEHRGKGYALQFGVDHLRGDAPDIVVILDADCLLKPGALDVLVATAAGSGRPVQALYLMDSGTDPSIQQKISTFAFKLKNSVRFSAMKRLGLPCPLAGTGMAFPWPVIETAALATGDIVEDMKLGIDLAIAGHPAVFEPRAEVRSRFPDSREGQGTQRRRWEHGHLSTIAGQTPRLVPAAIRQRRLDLAGMALDLMIPPLSFLVLVLATLLILSAVTALWGGSGLALGVSAAATGIAGLSFLAAWHGFGRDILTAGDLIAIPCYVAQKIPLYARALVTRERQWIRSVRHRDDGGA